MYQKHPRYNEFILAQERLGVGTRVRVCSRLGFIIEWDMKNFSGGSFVILYDNGDCRKYHPIFLRETWGIFSPNQINVGIGESFKKYCENIFLSRSQS